MRAPCSCSSRASSPSQAAEQARAEQEVATQKLRRRARSSSVSERELGVAAAQLGLRTVRSPFNGVVVDRYVNVGERVEDKPLLRVAVIDPLRVEADGARPAATAASRAATGLPCGRSCRAPRRWWRR